MSKARQQQVADPNSSAVPTVSVAELDEFIAGCFSNLKSGSLNSRRAASAVKIPQITEGFARALALAARDCFMSQAPLLELQAPIKVAGDIHGQFTDLLRLFDACGIPPASNYLFLGDYVDRGKHSVETMMLLFALKCKFPENIFLLRGNHECASINRIYGFFDECKRKFGSIRVWKTMVDAFNCLPIAAVIEDKIFCCHGGLSPELSSMQQIQKIVRPCDVADTGLICDLLWSDPDDGLGVGWSENESRGVSYTWGADVVHKFLKKFDFDLICRGHQICEQGYQFGSNRSVVTVFSAPNYCNEFDNSGAVMSIDADLMCSFSILRPVYRA